MEISLVPLAVVLGIKHSMDPDHVISISNFLRRSGSSGSALLTGCVWALGHTLTASAITAVLFLMKDSLFLPFLGELDRVVGAALIAMGILALADAFRIGVNPHAHSHRHGKLTHSHEHEGAHHTHSHAFGMGLLQGLASNDELIILFASSLGVRTIGGIAFAAAAFGAGVFAGMIAFSLLFFYPIARLKSARVRAAVAAVAGLASVAYGARMLLLS